MKKIRFRRRLLALFLGALVGGMLPNTSVWAQPAARGTRSAPRPSNSSPKLMQRVPATDAADEGTATPGPSARTAARGASNAERPRGAANGAPRGASQRDPAAANPVSPSGPSAPPGFPLSPQDQERVDQILHYWETQTAKIKTFQCSFTRQNFDVVFGDTEHPITIDRGEVRYSHPDKGLMRVDEVWKYNAQLKTDPPYEKQKVDFGEYWVCDGRAVFLFDAKTKTLTETRLPPEAQGQAIADGPLPFLFGAKAQTMKERYWIREITPQTAGENEYWLEAIPKRQLDAANFSAIHVQLRVAKDQLMPFAMKVLEKSGYRVYHFEKHAPNDPRDRVAEFLKFFVAPKAPIGWTKVIEDWNGQPLDERGNPLPPTSASEAPAEARDRKPTSKRR